MGQYDHVQQYPLWSPRSDWRPPRLSELPSWAGAKRVGLDVETYDPDLKEMGIGVRRPNTYLAGFSFAIEDGPEFYVPLRHEGGDNVENPEAALRYLKDQSRAFQGDLCGANLSYDLDYLAEESITFRSIRRLRDALVADPLINELHFSYQLDDVAKRWGLPGKDEELIREAATQLGLDPKRDIAKLPARFVGPYGTQDARLPLQLLRRQEKEIEKQDLEGVYALECSLITVLLKIRRRGILVDQGRLSRIEDWALRAEAEALHDLRDLTGVSVAVGDVWKPSELAPALESIGYTPDRTSTGQPSITKDSLQDIQRSCPEGSTGWKVATAISRARKVNKLRTTFVHSVREHMINGRIHCTLNSLRQTDDFRKAKGGRFGRLAAENPNMQQQPSRDEFAKEWRSIYVPESGCQWTSSDYSQQEPRMLVHYADIMGLPGAAEAAERYRNDPKTDSHSMMAELSGVPRSQGKIIFLARCYGQGGASLCHDLGLPTRWAYWEQGGWDQRVYFDTVKDAEDYCHSSGLKFSNVHEMAGTEGQAIIDQFDERLPYVKQLSKRAENKAKRVGYVKTLSGRRCRFPRNNGRVFWAHKALNRIIQGSSADQTKKALVDADSAGHYIQLQVHDEICASHETVAQGRELGRIMLEAYKLRLPFKVDVEMGPSWGEAKGID